ncbi:MAG: cache domain-containing protein, partial [Moraxellaceae bacterium]|nr:cache domain-containing protein [Moraxellaceae bacterium]
MSSLLKRLRNMPMGARLFLFSTGLLGLFLLLAIIFVSVASYRFATQRVDDDLQVGERVFHQVLLQKQSQLRQSAQVLAADFGFRAALASGDAETISSALVNQSSRINASLAVAIDLQGTVIASSTPHVRPGASYPAADHLRANSIDGGGAVAFVGNRPLELIMVPVKAPLPIGWVMLGFELDDAALREVAALVEMDVSLLADTPSGWALYASSLEHGNPQGLIELLSEATDRRRIDLDGQSSQWRAFSLPTVGDAAVMVVLTRSFAEAFAPYRQLLLLLVLL